MIACHRHLPLFVRIPVLVVLGLIFVALVIILIQLLRDLKELRNG